MEAAEAGGRAGARHPRLRGRFGAGLPRINDGSLLFLQHMLSKMQPVGEDGTGGGGLAEEGFYTPDGIEQAWSRLRAPLRPELAALIERRGGRVRLSTHRRYVSWDRRRLAEHVDDRVHALVRQLPGDPLASSYGGNVGHA